MKTNFHVEMDLLLVKLRKNPKHWYIKEGSPRLLWCREAQAQVTVKRGLFAAYIDDIPANYDVVSKCGDNRCVNPEHQELKTSRNKSRELSLPSQLISFKRSNTFRKPDPPVKLPVGLSMKQGLMAKTRFNIGSSVLAVHKDTGIPVPTLLRIKGGDYDHILSRAPSLETPESMKEVNDHIDKAYSEKELGARDEVTIQLPEVVTYEDAAEVVSSRLSENDESREGEPEIAGASEEELEWLKTIGRG